MPTGNAIPFVDCGTTGLRICPVGVDANYSTRKAARGVLDRMAARWRQAVVPRRAILCGMVKRKGERIKAPDLFTGDTFHRPVNVPVKIDRPTGKPTA